MYVRVGNRERRQNNLQYCVFSCVYVTMCFSLMCFCASGPENDLTQRLGSQFVVFLKPIFNSNKAKTPDHSSLLLNLTPFYIHQKALLLSPAIHLGHI